MRIELDHATKTIIAIQVLIERRFALEEILHAAANYSVSIGCADAYIGFCALFVQIDKAATQEELDEIEAKARDLTQKHTYKLREVGYSLNLLRKNLISIRHGLELRAEQQVEFSQLQQGRA